MVLSTSPQSYLSTYASDYSWPQKISRSSNTSSGTLAREGIFPVQIRSRIKTPPLMFNPFLNKNEDGWLFKCAKKKVQIAIAEYGSRIIKATIDGQSIDPSRIFLQQADGDRPVGQLASGEFLRHLQLIASGEESLEIRKEGSQKQVMITSKPDASPKCSLAHYGPAERRKLSSSRSKIMPLFYAQSSRKQTRQPPHPLSKPENSFRVELHREFFDKVIPTILLQLGCSESAKADYLPIWIIFCGVGGTNKQYFCHITEDNATSAVYNSCDSENPEMPVLLFGQPAFIAKDKIEEIRTHFPDQHQNLPVQAAYAVSPTSLPIPIPHRGTNSLRFDDVKPISYWSHTSRSKVIYTALEELENKGGLSSEETERLQLYRKAIELDKELEDLYQKQKIYQGRLDRANTNGIERAIRGEEERVKNHKKKIDEKILELKEFKNSNITKLPGSYTSATFQFSFGSRDSFYKRLSNGGILLSASNPPNDLIDSRNDVHIPYRK